MTDFEKKICDTILKEGRLYDHFIAHVDGGIKVDYYIVHVEGYEYHLTKHNDEFVYFFRGNKIDAD